MKNIYCILILSCLLLFSLQCQSQQQGVGDIQHIKWKSQKDFEIRDIVEDVQYILLENRTECLFSYIDKLIIEDNRIYILDFDKKSLFVFDITGKFLHQIGRMGGGPGEYTRYINFDVYDNIVYVYDFSKRRMLIYDENGKYKESVRPSFRFFDFYILEQKKYLLSLSHDDDSGDNNNKIVVTGDMKKSEIAHFSFSRDFKDNKSNVRAFHPFQNKVVYMHPVSDTLYILNGQGNVENGYFFDFGNKKLPERLKNDYTEAIKQERDNDYIYILNTPIRIKEYIFAELSVRNKQRLAVFDIQKNKLTYELITPEKFNIKNINFPLYAMNDSILVSFIDYSMYEVAKDKTLLDSKVIEHLSN
ncbi:MAG: 6-bladed beta-propeller, partial [Prevotellaceae bacterium]|nr:6-bladed beta-propeller [Prevotellaceae bacterium]